MDKGYTKVVNEFNITVPWGEIAIKAWGSSDLPHVLMVHGTADNSGTFDNLIPLLPDSNYYVCIDLPGHGKSSHFPPFVPIHASYYLIACKLVTNYFNKEKYIFIGHSLGGQIGYLFCRIYPHLIEKFISLDALPFFPVEVSRAVKYYKNLLEKNFTLQEKLKINSPDSYSYDEALEAASKNRYHGEVLTKKATEPLLKRSLKPVGNGKYILTTDERVLYPLPFLHDSRFVMESMNHDPIECPVLLIIATKNTYPLKRYVSLMNYVNKLKNIKIVYVDGKHDIHNNNPEMVSPHVTGFLLSRKSKL